MACCRRRSGARIPLLSFCADYARLRSRSAEHAAELCSWTDACSSPRAHPRRKRKGACAMRPASSRTSAGGRIPTIAASRACILIAQSALGGIDHPGRVFLALAIYFRHVGGGREDDEQTDSLSERLKEIVPKKLYRRARIIGAAIRAASHAFDRPPRHHRRDRRSPTRRTSWYFPCPRPMQCSTANACAADSRPWPSCWSGNSRSASDETSIPVSLAHGRHDRHLAV